MKVLLQRVSRGAVSTDGEKIAEIGPGLLLLVGFGRGDSVTDLEWMLRKVLDLRIFPDESGNMNLSVTDTSGALLIVSQFTLHADPRKGRRPSFVRAALPEDASLLYDTFVALARRSGLQVGSGEFGAMMEVELVNSGPVTIMLDSPSERVQ